MNAANFLQRITFIVNGHGFKRSILVPLRETSLADDGATLTITLSTNPGFDKVDSNIIVLSWAADKVIPAAISVQIPNDYDTSDDYCKLLIKAKMSGTTATTTAITAAAYKVSATTTDLAPSQTVDMTDSYQWLELDISGKSLTAGEVVQFVLTPEAHATDAIEIAAMKLEIRSDLVYADKTNR